MRRFAVIAVSVAPGAAVELEDMTSATIDALR
jgi:hypothetical protein